MGVCGKKLNRNLHIEKNAGTKLENYLPPSKPMCQSLSLNPEASCLQNR